MKERLDSFIAQKEGQLTLEVVDISQKENSRFFFQYRYDIPVVTLDGYGEIARHRLTGDDILKLEEILAKKQ